MEILILVLLYYLSQNPEFQESAKPLMEQLKGSQELLRFVNDLSKFTQGFNAFQSTPPNSQTEKKSTPETANESKQKTSDFESNKKNPQSPTEGIADSFIQGILENYFKKQS